MGPGLLRDAALNRVLRNAARLLGGNALQSLAWLLSVFLAAHGLGVEGFGRLALVTSYCAIVSQLFGFQSSYALIKVATLPLARSRLTAFFSAIRARAWIAAAPAPGGALLAAAGLAIAAQLSLLNTATALAGYVSCAAVLFGATGAATALLRLLDRYDAFIVQGAAAGIARVAFTGAALLAGGDLLDYAVAWALAQMRGDALLWVLAWAAARARGLPARLYRFRKAFRMFPELWPFLVSTNLSASLRAVREMDTLIVGFLLDAAGAGLFRIARQFGTALTRIVDPLYHAIYPDLAAIQERAGPAGVVQPVARAAATGGAAGPAIALAFLALGPQVVVLAAGADFAGAFAASFWCIVGAAIWGGCQSFGAALLAWNRHRALLRLHFVITTLYLGLLVILAPAHGVAGAGAANAALFFAWGSGAAIMVWREARRRLPGGASAPG